MVHTPLTNIRRTYAYPEACYALAHPFYRPGQRYPAGRAARCGRTRVVCRSERSLRHALDGRESPPRVLLGARLLPLARRAYPRYPLHRVRPPRHEPFAALPTRDALGVLAPALPERPHRSRVAPGDVARGARGDVRCRHRRDRDPERHDTWLPLVARRPTSARLLHRHKPMEHAAAPERVTASGWGSAAGMAGVAGALGVGVGKSSSRRRRYRRPSVAMILVHMSDHLSIREQLFRVPSAPLWRAESWTKVCVERVFYFASLFAYLSLWRF